VTVIKRRTIQGYYQVAGFFQFVDGSDRFEANDLALRGIDEEAGAVPPSTGLTAFK
jgi:hypothetical protein